MWFRLSIAALLCWSGSDLFSKLGCADPDNKTAHVEMVVAVGLVMGVHAVFGIFVEGVVITPDIILKYLPVSALYIASMTVGYCALRYIELSVSSPVCNSSGTLVAIASLIYGGFSGVSPVMLIAMALVCLGVIALGFAEYNEDAESRERRQEKANYKYAKSAVAIILPLVYCVLDAAGTFADSLVLEHIDEGSANVAYELTFFAAAVVSFVYVRVIKGKKPTFRPTVARYVGAGFETAGQLAYVYAIADSGHVMLSAPIISSYCALSVVWSRIFLKEKMSKKHYAAIAVTVLGIVIMGIFDA